MKWCSGIFLRVKSVEGNFPREKINYVQRIARRIGAAIPRCSSKKGDLKNFAIFAGKHLFYTPPMAATGRMREAYSESYQRSMKHLWN